jgi:hypothetical protein
VNYERLYSFRFRDIDQDGRIAVWQQIGPHVHGLMGSPQKVLDPAAGRGEFIGAIPAKETWAVDAVSYDEAAHKPDTKVITAMIMDAELPTGHFDGVFVSNFLEHLYDQEAIAAFLEKMNASMESGGRIAIMGPNYRYCSDEYWDCADHYVALTHVAIEEHLYAAGFEIERVIPRYLPYSFRGILPPSPALKITWPAPSRARSTVSGSVASPTIRSPVGILAATSATGSERVRTFGARPAPASSSTMLEPMKPQPMTRIRPGTTCARSPGTACRAAARRAASSGRRVSAAARGGGCRCRSRGGSGG